MTLRVVRLCDSGGQWTGTAPQCRLISCGDPPMLPHSAVALLNGSTQWRAQALYSCLPGYNNNDNVNGKDSTKHQRISL